MDFLTVPWRCQAHSYLMVSALDVSPSASHQAHSLIYFRSLLQCRFLRRPPLTTRFKIKIISLAAPSPLSPLSWFTSLQSTQVGCSPFTLGRPLPSSPSFSVPLRLFCRDYLNRAPLCSGLQLSLANGRHQKGLEGERREKPECLFPQPLSVQGLRLEMAALPSQGPTSCWVSFSSTHSCCSLLIWEPWGVSPYIIGFC